MFYYGKNNIEISGACSHYAVISLSGYRSTAGDLETCSPHPPFSFFATEQSLSVMLPVTVQREKEL